MRQRQSTPASLSYGVASERRMTNNDKMVNLESAHQHCRFTALGESMAIHSFVIRASLIDSSFVIRHSDFVISKIRVNPWLAKPIENPMDDLCAQGERRADIPRRAKRCAKVQPILRRTRLCPSPCAYAIPQAYRAPSYHRPISDVIESGVHPETFSSCRPIPIPNPFLARRLPCT